jgi:putative hydrolase of the HAD superfamily
VGYATNDEGFKPGMKSMVEVHSKLITNTEAILFDINGTLRVRELHDPTQQAANTHILELLDKDNVPELFWEELTRRHKAYGTWAQQNLIQLSEKEIWTRWILPDSPLLQIEPVADELTLLWSERKGRTVPRQGATDTLLELKRRGYRLGVISNTMSTLDIPRSLDRYGWTEFFEVVILSSFVKFRKPSPEPFLEAIRLLNIDPGKCAYVGNRISKDLVGCNQAGFGLGILLNPPEYPRNDEIDLSIQPDLVIKSLCELLDIFPMRKNSLI